MFQFWNLRKLIVIIVLAGAGIYLAWFDRSQSIGKKQLHSKVRLVGRVIQNEWSEPRQMGIYLLKDISGVIPVITHDPCPEVGKVIAINAEVVTTGTQRKLLKEIERIQVGAPNKTPK